MKKLLILTIASLACNLASAQFVAKMEVKEPIPGICDNNEVYALISSFKGQEEATCPSTKEEIQKRLNAEIRFLQDNPKYKDKGMIGLLINCKGEVVRCQMDNKTQSPELDKQIEAVFNTLGPWTAGKLDGKQVDSSLLFSFKIKGGKLTLN